MQGTVLADPAAREGPRTVRKAALLVSPATLLVVVLLCLPLCLILRYSLDIYDARQLMLGVFSLDSYREILFEAHYRKVLLRTLAIAAAAAVGTLVLAAPLAYCISRSRSEPVRSTLLVLMILPMLLGNGVRSAAWMILLGSKGILNSMLTFLGVISAPLELLYTQEAVVVALIAVLVPFAVIILQGVFDAIPIDLENAAKSLGCSPLKAFWLVVVPVGMPGFASAGVIAFTLAMNAYATPVLIGGPTVKMMGPEVYDAIAQANNWPVGSALACVLIAITAALTIASAIYLTRRRT